MKRRGYTLMELLVVTAVLGVVTTLGMRAFNAVAGYARTQSLRMELAAEAQRVFEFLERDFGNVVAAARAGQTLSGGVPASPAGPLPAGQLVLPVEETAPGGTEQRVRVTYRVEHNPAGARLVREAEPLGGTSGIRSVVTFPDVAGMQLGFAEGFAWRGDWTAPTHPRSVRVSLVLQDPDRPYEQIAREAIFTVHVP